MLPNWLDKYLDELASAGRMLGSFGPKRPPVDKAAQLELLLSDFRHGKGFDTFIYRALTEPRTDVAIAFLLTVAKESDDAYQRFLAVRCLQCLGPPDAIADRPLLDALKREEDTDQVALIVGCLRGINPSPSPEVLAVIAAAHERAHARSLAAQKQAHANARTKGWAAQLDEWEKCVACGKAMEIVATCPHCGYTHWARIVLMLLASGFFFVSAILGHLMIEGPIWRNVVRWGCAGLGAAALLMGSVAVAVGLMRRGKPPSENAGEDFIHNEDAERPKKSPNNGIHLVCPSCGKRMKTAASAAGKKVQCPACKKPIQVSAVAEGSS